MLNAGILDTLYLFFESRCMPFGSILAPFLFNIYMHEFDMYIRKLRKEIECPIESIYNKIKSPKLFYVRYLDEFIFGFLGSKKTVDLFRKRIIQFLRNKLYLKIKKDLMVSCTDKGIRFGGYLINISYFNMKKQFKNIKIQNVSLYKKRVLARLAVSDARLANLAILGMKKLFFNIFCRLVQGQFWSQTVRHKAVHTLAVGLKASIEGAGNPALQR